MAKVHPPIGVSAPLCSCGCGDEVNWMPGKGWATYVKGHAGKGKPGTRLGVKLDEDTKQRMRQAALTRYKGKRNRDKESTPGLGVYATHEYKEARKWIEGQSCLICGSNDKIHAHHQVPGDDSTLIPVCSHCHPTLHAGPGAKGSRPPAGEQPPLCACGCGRPVLWKRVRGWATYRRGHGSAKIPAGTKDQKAPLCACGCGERTKFRFGIGWNKFKRGHGQRVYGHYSQKAKH